ncbi:MAG: GGDEF domain-containing protein [bacterium]
MDIVDYLDPNTYRSFFDNYVFYTDTPPEEEEAFQQYLRKNTVQRAFPLFGFLAVIVLLFWPTDFFVFSDPEIFWTYVIWRSCVVGGIAVLLFGLTVSEFIRRHVNVFITGIILLICLGIGYAFGRVSDLTEPWFWVIVIIPWITLFLGLKPLQRFIATFLLIAAYGTGFVLPFPEHLAYARLNTVIILLSGMVFMISAAGHVLYHFLRQDFFHQKELEEKKKQLRYLARYDQLTDLYNRRVFEEELEKEFDRTRRYDHPLTILMIDLDHFKKINDTYGHQAGDEVLEVFGQLIDDSTRSSDIGGRYGGEEFCVVLPETDSSQAKKTAERLRSSLGEHTFTSDDGEEFSVTCSIGMAERRKGMDDFTDLIKAADEALYAAKDQGRNRIVSNA